MKQTRRIIKTSAIEAPCQSRDGLTNITFIASEGAAPRPCALTALATIPFGETRCYAEIAERLRCMSGFGRKWLLADEAGEVPLMLTSPISGSRSIVPP